MNRSIIISSVLHLIIIMITALSLPFLAKKPIDLPPIVSIELIQISDKTNIPFAPKAKKIIEKIKEKEKKLVSEQAPPKKVKKMKDAASNLEFEEAAKLRDEIRKLETTELEITLNPKIRQYDVKNKLYPKGRSTLGMPGTKVTKKKDKKWKHKK